MICSQFQGVMFPARFQVLLQLLMSTGLRPSSVKNIRAHHLAQDDESGIILIIVERIKCRNAKHSIIHPVGCNCHITNFGRPECCLRPQLQQNQISPWCLIHNFPLEEWKRFLPFTDLDFSTTFRPLGLMPFSPRRTVVTSCLRMFEGQQRYDKFETTFDPMTDKLFRDHIKRFMVWSAKSAV